MTAKRIVAGVDSSTQSCKVELFDLDTGHRIGGGAAPHPAVHPPTSEQDPETWWLAFLAAFGRALTDADVAPSAVVGLSVAAQCHGLVVLDEADRVIRPAKLWNDTTSAEDIARLRRDIGDATLVGRLGTLPTSAFTLGKLAWLARVEPAALARTAHILLPHDYLTFRLTGRRVTDRSEASGTGYFDAETNEYLPGFLARIDPDRDWAPLLPEVLGPDEAAGPVVGSACELLGLSPDVVVGAGGGDQHAAALGLGITGGDVVYSFGTSGVVSALSRVPVRDPTGAVAGVAGMADGWMPLASTLNAARTTDTFARLLGTGHDEFARLALAADPRRAPVLAPYLDGERTPDLPGAVGILAGITTETSREDVAFAAHEGVVLGLVRGQRHLERMGVAVDGRTLAVGGGARSPAYRQVLADATGTPVAVTDVSEATARGAAVQAAAVTTGSPVSVVRDAWAPSSTVVAGPRPEAVDRRAAFEAVTSIRSLDRS